MACPKLWTKHCQNFNYEGCKFSKKLGVKQAGSEGCFQKERLSPFRFIRKVESIKRLLSLFILQEGPIYIYSSPVTRHTPRSKHTTVYTGICMGTPFDSSRRWKTLNQFSPFPHFPSFLILSKHLLPIEYNNHMWQVSSQLCAVASDKFERDSTCSKDPINTFAKSNRSLPRKLANGAHPGPQYQKYIFLSTNAVNWSWANNAIWRHKSGSTLAQVMIYYLNQCWLIISEV